MKPKAKKPTASAQRFPESETDRELRQKLSPREIVPAIVRIGATFGFPPQSAVYWKPNHSDLGQELGMPALRLQTIAALVLAAAPLAAFSLRHQTGSSGNPPPPQTPDFAREVRPILAKNCFKCHGPDEKTRKAKLRLDVPGAPSGVVVPGKPGESELIARIFSDDPDTVMPPPSTKVTLTAAQKDILKRWIAAGARYEQHWAFVPPRAAAPPIVADAGWAKNPIDRFVLARLEKEGLQPAPAADRYTLVRRVSLDLIGLPPTPDEVDAFVNDDSANAYEKVVDRLLASPHYGERWARRWLDLARYADTNGYEKDRPRVIWPYRDWVIKALNADMPFDQFTIEQLAGDMLPGARPEQIIATGFHRNTMMNEEGGIDPLEFRWYAVVDRVNTTATTWLGLTLGCAQCHSHKYDPITQREYYQMLAFLNNADEPDYEVADPAIGKRRADVEAKIGDLTASLPAKFPGGAAALDKALAAWDQAESARAVVWELLRPTSMKATMPHLELLDDGSVLASGDQTKSDTYTLTFATKIEGVTALRVEVLPDESLPDRGPGRVYYEGRKGDFFLSELTLETGGKPVRFGGASQDHPKGQAAHAIDGNPATGWSTNGEVGRAHEAVFTFAQPVNLEGAAKLTMLFERYYASGLGRFRIWVTTDPRKTVRASGHGTAIDAILAKAADRRSAGEVLQLRQRFLEVCTELADARKEIEKLRAALPAFTATLVLKERPPTNPRPTHIHHRGEFLQPKEAVEPGVLSVLHPLAAGLPRNRLGLARWLMAPENPLTARVTMNRQWQALFGRGFVHTTEDLGLQGELPSHPELLDWLACEFVKQGWSLKKMHKLMVMSATYRQSSRVTPELLRRDPQNKLLARGPRVRLEAEAIRDSLLRVSGLLAPKLGGPSVFPPQPPSVSTEGVYGPLKWTVSPGQDRYRRGLYTFLKRSIPYAMFATFDGVTGENCLGRREISNTALQALTMLNDLVVIEAAQKLGSTLAAAPGFVEARTIELFRRCLTRPPSAEERAAIADFFSRQQVRLRKGELDAKAIAGPGEGDLVERAAWTLLARAVLNLDEMLTKE
jgi:hypothetical protein